MTVTKKALIIVDIQNDFLPDGSLPVRDGDAIIPVVNALSVLPFDLIVATQDWHPANHVSFASNHHRSPGEIITLSSGDQILWPTHCVENTWGADFSKLLIKKHIDKVFHKGTDPTIDSYSTFFDNGHKKSTGLDRFLLDHHITDVYIVGLATDYCVKYSALDALNLGFNVYIVVDGCRGVNLSPNDTEVALETLRHAGAVCVNSHQVAANIFGLLSR